MTMTPDEVEHERAEFETAYIADFGSPFDEGTSDSYARGYAAGAEWAWLARSALAREDHAALVEALDNLIFTARHCWDQIKPIKDVPGTLRVTHPIIEEACAALARARG